MSYDPARIRAYGLVPVTPYDAPEKAAEREAAHEALLEDIASARRAWEARDERLAAACLGWKAPRPLLTEWAVVELAGGRSGEEPWEP